jgi:hypothetical protein
MHIQGLLVTEVDWRLSSQTADFQHPTPLTTFRNGHLYPESASVSAIGAVVGEK